MSSRLYFHQLSDVALGPHSLLDVYEYHFIPGAPISFEQFAIITGEQDRDTALRYLRRPIKEDFRGTGVS